MMERKFGPTGAPLANCETEKTCVTCEVCLKEIPVSVADSHEGEDYVHHFCGLECLDAWHKRSNRSNV